MAQVMGTPYNKVAVYLMVAVIGGIVGAAYGTNAKRDEIIAECATKNGFNASIGPLRARIVCNIDKLGV